jgi:hypothetical protein
MFSAESALHSQANFGKVPMPSLPGIGGAQAQPNPFAGIRRAGQAKRAQNFEKFQDQKNNDQTKMGQFGSGAKNRLMGGDFGTQAGSMKQKLFS